VLLSEGQCRDSYEDGKWEDQRYRATPHQLFRWTTSLFGANSKDEPRANSFLMMLQPWAGLGLPK
jgi:hypothetical protein